MNKPTNKTAVFSSPVAERLVPLAVFFVIAINWISTFAADATVSGALPPQRLDKGGVAITFDDRHFSEWINAMPLFDKYGARATFFISRAIDRPAMDAARTLQSHGHAIGAHGVHHLAAAEYRRKRSMEDYIREEILPQVEAFKAAGITPAAFAYPMSNNNAITDKAMLQVFRHVRTGGFVDSGEQVSGRNAFFVPAEKIAEHGCLHGKGIDDAPSKEDRTYEQLDAALARAAKDNEIIVFYAHGIATSGKHHHITPEALERILSKAKELHLTFYTFDDLP